jgi:hypothetical protein
MAEQQRAEDGDEPLELTNVVDPDDPDADDQQRSDDDPDPQVNDEDGDETVVAFEGEEPEAEPENSTVRQMRKALREKDRELAELRKTAAPKPIEVGEKPTLAGCDFDDERFEQELDAWKDRKAAADRQQETQAEQNRKANEEWQQDLSAFEQKKGALQFPDRDETIDTAIGSLDLVQQAVVIKAASDPSIFLYALGKSETKRAELAKIQDPIKLAAAVARMEGAVKVTKGRKAPEPDRPLTGSAKMPGGADKELERIEKKALATGDRTELIRYRKRMAERNGK